MTQKALKLALDALEKNTKHLPADFDYHFEAITAIKEALAQTQEPVAHWSDCSVHSEPAYPKGECDCGGIVAVADYTALSDKYVALSDKYVALSDKYVALKARPPQTQEPVQFKCTVIDDVHPSGIPLEQWTSPPQRTWVGLTDEVITQVIDSMPKKMKGFMVDWDLYEFSKAYEAQLKEKNNGV